MSKFTLINRNNSYSAYYNIIYGYLYFAELDVTI